MRRARIIVTLKNEKDHIPLLITRFWIYWLWRQCGSVFFSTPDFKARWNSHLSWLQIWSSIYRTKSLPQSQRYLTIISSLAANSRGSNYNSHSKIWLFRKLYKQQREKQGGQKKTEKKVLKTLPLHEVMPPRDIQFL